MIVLLVITLSIVFAIGSIAPLFITEEMNDVIDTRSRRP